MVSEINIDPGAPIQVGNLTTFEVQFVDADGTAIDISAASSLAIKLEDPDAIGSSNVAAFKTDGTDGWITATITPAKLGAFKIQGVATIAAAEKHTGRGAFVVVGNLP